MTPADLRTALADVIDPEIRQPITELDMVGDIEVEPAGDGFRAEVTIKLTTAGCPMKDTISSRVRDRLAAAGVTELKLTLGAMTDAERNALRTKLRGGEPDPVIPFTKTGNLTRIYAVASGKGGVGKSSVTANLAAAMAESGHKVGVIDADVYGFSIPRMLGVEHAPTKVDDMILPPVAKDVKVISIGMFTEPGRPVVWRGPMLHRALQQFLADVFWGDLDVLLLDLPPGTGDIAISVAQLLPHAEILLVTTPQLAAAEVAERAGLMARQTRQKVAGVIENMSWLEQPDGSRLELFGSGGGERIASRLSEIMNEPVPLLGQIPLDMSLREGGDAGVPSVLSHQTTEANSKLRGIASDLARTSRSLAGRKLPLTPV